MVDKLIRYNDVEGIKRHMGNKVLVFINSRVYGYEILAYKGIEPDTLRLVGEIDNPPYKVLSRDTAYDRIFGNPLYNM